MPRWRIEAVYLSSRGILAREQVLKMVYMHLCQLGWVRYFIKGMLNVLGVVLLIPDTDSNAYTNANTQEDQSCQSNK